MRARNNVICKERINNNIIAECQNYKHITIGFYDDVDEAGRVAEESRQQYYGKFAGKS